MPVSRVGQSTLFAFSPVVIAAQLEAAQQLGWPHQAIGWEEKYMLVKPPLPRSSGGDIFRPVSATGVAATLSKFYAGAEITRGLTTEIATRPEVS